MTSRLCRSVDGSWSCLQTPRAPGQGVKHSTLWWYVAGNCSCTVHSLSESGCIADHEVLFCWLRLWRNQVEWQGLYHLRFWRMLLVFWISVFVPKEANSDHQAWMLRCAGRNNHRSQSRRPYVEPFLVLGCLVCSGGPILYIMKTHLFKYIEKFTSKNWKFSDKKIWNFFIFLFKT